ncbi:TPA: hypothetical protein PC537_003960 [Morganella morganii]|nr:hypothetical protein [Morganella morganii]
MMTSININTGRSTHRHYILGSSGIVSSGFFTDNAKKEIFYFITHTKSRKKRNKMSIYNGAIPHSATISAADSD